MMMNSSIVIFRIFVSACLVCPAAFGAKPNVIFYLTDDLGYSDISCYGAEKVQTPHIDQLASGGIQFMDFHTAASICSPSRAAFLTGAYPQRTGLYMGINQNRPAHWFLGLAPREITIAEQFKSQGYKTYMIGKWHLGSEPEFHPKKQGFDSYYGAPDNMRHSTRFYDEETLIYQDTPLDQLTELYTARATEIIRKSGETPFFLYFAHNYPHTPYEAGEKFKGSSQDGTRGDIIQELDWGIGEIMKALEAAGIADNTLFIFSSDNGPLDQEYARPYSGTKFISFEGGHRVPFILHWPAGIRESSQSATPVHAMDLFSTLSEMIDAPLPDDRVYDGISLMPLFSGDEIERSSTEPFYYYNCENLQAVRMGEWKLHLPRTKREMAWWEKGRGRVITDYELYHLEKDPAESQNIASQHPEIVQRLQSLADDIRKELGEFGQRGSGQRPTGSVIPDAPIISNMRDWKTVAKSTRDQIEAVRLERHPSIGSKQSK